MTVSLLVPIQRRPFRGYADPGLPNGIWIVQSSVLGDAGGGNLLLDIVFKDGSLVVPESSLLYNIEQLNLFVSDTNDQIASVNPANWDDITPGATGTTGTIVGWQLSSMSAVNGSVQRLFDGGHMGTQVRWFLGQVRKNTTNTIVRFQVANAAKSLSIKAEGYIWGPEAVNAPGGPRRPADSLYG